MDIAESQVVQGEMLSIYIAAENLCFYFNKYQAQ